MASEPPSSVAARAADPRAISIDAEERDGVREPDAVVEVVLE